MTPGEAERLRRLPHLAVALYAIALRPRAAADGWVRGVTWRELCAELAVPAYGRDAAFAPYRQQLQRALAHLVDAGLVEAAGQGFEFAARCILVCNVQDNVRTKPRSSAAIEERNVRDNVRKSTQREDANVREKTSNTGDLGEGSVRDGAGVDSMHGSPLPPSPFSPLINPPISPSTLPPSASPAQCAKCRGTGRGWSQGIPGTVPTYCQACNGTGYAVADRVEKPEPAFTLTMQPGEDPPVQPQMPMPDRHRIATTWVPTQATLKALEQKGVPPAVALAEVGHFVLWWQDATQREGSKRASGWQLAFLKWCTKLAPTKNAPVTGREGTTGGREYADRATQQQPRRSASERNRDATRQHFAGRTDFPDD